MFLYFVGFLKLCQNGSDEYNVIAQNEKAQKLVGRRSYIIKTVRFNAMLSMVYIHVVAYVSERTTWDLLDIIT